MTQQNFLSDESGAVTVDWVVLTAALVGLGLAVMGVISTGISSQSSNIDDQLTSGTIIRTAFTGSASDARDTACGTSTYCSDDLNSAALQAMTTADLTAESTVDYGSDFLNDTGLTVDSDGVVSDSDFQAQYDTEVAASTAQNDLLAAEQSARAN